MAVLGHAPGPHIMQTQGPNKLANTHTFVQIVQAIERTVETTTTGRAQFDNFYLNSFLELPKTPRSPVPAVGQFWEGQQKCLCTDVYGLPCEDENFPKGLTFSFNLFKCV